MFYIEVKMATLMDSRELRSYLLTACTKKYQVTGIGK